MILEHKIRDCLGFFGAMNNRQIQSKLSIIGLNVELIDIDQALRLLVINKMVRHADFDPTNQTYLIRCIR